MKLVPARKREPPDLPLGWTVTEQGRLESPRRATATGTLVQVEVLSPSCADDGAVDAVHGSQFFIPGVATWAGGGVGEGAASDWF